MKSLSLVSMETELCTVFTQTFHSSEHSAFVTSRCTPRRCHRCCSEGEGCQAERCRALPCPRAILALCPAFCTPWSEIIHGLQRQRAVEAQSLSSLCSHTSLSKATPDSKLQIKHHKFKLNCLALHQNIPEIPTEPLLKWLRLLFFTWFIPAHLRASSRLLCDFRPNAHTILLPLSQA